MTEKKRLKVIIIYNKHIAEQKARNKEIRRFSKNALPDNVVMTYNDRLEVCNICN